MKEDMMAVDPRSFIAPIAAEPIAETDPQIGPVVAAEDAKTTTFTVILEREPELAGVRGYVYDYTQWTESIEAVDLDEAWRAARVKYYMSGYVDPASNSRVQIVDIKSGVVELAPVEAVTTPAEATGSEAEVLDQVVEAEGLVKERRVKDEEVSGLSIKKSS